MSTSPVQIPPKAVLYYNPESLWCAAVLLALEEKGYTDDDLEFKVVDLDRSDNFSPGYVRLNSGATVPTMVVPLQSSLVPDAPRKFRALTDTKTILEFLDKTRSPMSRGRGQQPTYAPAPTLSPATVSLAEISNTIIALLHQVPINFLMFAAINTQELQAQANGRPGTLVKNRSQALQRYLNDETDVAIPVIRTLWESRLVEVDILRQVYETANKPDGDLSPEELKGREVFFEKSVNAWLAIRDVFLRLEKDIIGPHVLGDQLSLVDLHLVAWVTRLFFLAGAPLPPLQKTPQISDIVDAPYPGYNNLEETIRKHTGDNGFTLGPKIRTFWTALKDRDSWVKVYGNGLH
ncbi:hypothetical protein M422DRAFT_30116 [Sphaerobolus stellatus SS14]|uniref:Unplaced genomic scaffold SPHSTscaffold_38, whole genome shotgun sequence n=1 Tax=Sphaerobolus stellatus (strain SS14) TaxID=990650 RepID=A0A0C9UQQ2_SPHS4|nr:hypothetical protein M422DRAFT_30116 [Sphaerobolus stellatus SS14]